MYCMALRLSWLSGTRTPYHRAKSLSYAEPVSFGSRAIIFMILDSLSPRTDRTVSTCIHANQFASTHQLYHCSSPLSMLHRSISIVLHLLYATGAPTSGGLNVLGFSSSFLMASPESFAPSISRPAYLAPIYSKIVLI